MQGKRDLSGKELFMMGGALFSMHFGASSMVWPMTWGKESGSAVFLAFIGAFLTSLLLPLLAYVALARGEGTYNNITIKAMPKFGSVFTNLTIIILGPLYAIPRMSASSWDAIVQATGFNPSSPIFIIVFSIVYYLITFWFISSRSKTMDRISKILFPILILIVALVILKGIITPISTMQPKTYSTPAIAYGFTEGYATAEILCALTFGIIILNGLKDKGVTKERMNINIIKVGVVGIGLLSLTHLGHMVIGASTGGTIDLKFVSLYTEVAMRLLGKVGGSLFCVALIFASLTTAIGMTAATAEFFADSTNGKISYMKAAIVTLVGSTVIGCIGLTGIVSYLAPLLDALYPGAIVLTLYYTLMPNCLAPRHLNMCSWAIKVSLVFGVFDAIYAYNGLFNLNLTVFESFYMALPLGPMKLSWVPGAIVALIIGYLTFKPSKTKTEKIEETV